MHNIHESQTDLSVCYGCGAKLGVDWLVYEVDLAGHGVRICRNHRYGSGEFKTSCMHKTLVKLNNVCRGCGETINRFSYEKKTMCTECRIAYKTGREIQAGKKKWYMIPQKWFRTGLMVEEYDRLHELFLYAISGTAEPRFNDYDICGEDLSEEDKELNAYNRDIVLMHTKQAKRVREFLKELSGFMKSAEESGRMEGSSLLRSLASGKMTLNEFNESREKLNDHEE